MKDYVEVENLSGQRAKCDARREDDRLGFREQLRAHAWANLWMIESPGLGVHSRYGPLWQGQKFGTLMPGQELETLVATGLEILKPMTDLCQNQGKSTIHTFCVYFIIHQCLSLIFPQRSQPLLLWYDIRIDFLSFYHFFMFTRQATP